MTEETKKQIAKGFTTRFVGKFNYDLYNELIEYVYEEVDAAEERGMHFTLTHLPEVLKLVKERFEDATS